MLFLPTGSSLLPPAVSIITVYYNTPEDLLRLSRSAGQHLDPGSYEMIVADNHSEQNLSSEFSAASYLRFPENFGFGRACNLAAEKASAPILFFVNPDCEFIENCLIPLMKTMDDSAVTGPKVLNKDGSIQLSFGPYLSIWNETQQKRLTLREQSEDVQHFLEQKTSAPFHPDYVSGCALMIHADIFRRINGFDENFFLYNEDVDLCKRITDIGKTITYQPSAKIVHYRNQSVDRIPGIAKAEYRKSQIYYYKKHQSSLQNLLLKLYLAFRGH